jgi:hypothetical protein
MMVASCDCLRRRPGALAEAADAVAVTVALMPLAASCSSIPDARAPVSKSQGLIPVGVDGQGWHQDLKKAHLCKRLQENNKISPACGTPTPPTPLRVWVTETLGPPRLTGLPLLPLLLSGGAL